MLVMKTFETIQTFLHPFPSPKQIIVCLMQMNVYLRRIRITVLKINEAQATKYYMRGLHFIIYKGEKISCTYQNLHLVLGSHLK
jgi:hypothetical protein